MEKTTTWGRCPILSPESYILNAVPSVVAITGVAVVTSAGYLSHQEKGFWEPRKKEAGEGVETTAAYPAEIMPIVAGRVDIGRLLGRPAPRAFGRLDDVCRAGCVGAALAAADLLTPHRPDKIESIGICVGSLGGCLQTDDAYSRTLWAQEPSPALFSLTLPSSIPSQIAIMLGISGPTHFVSAGEVSGLAAIEAGMLLVAQKEASAVICGGVDTDGAAMRDLARLRCQHWGQSLPTHFAGSAIFVLLEDLAHVQARQGTILALLTGSECHFDPVTIASGGDEGPFPVKQFLPTPYVFGCRGLSLLGEMLLTGVVAGGRLIGHDPEGYGVILQWAPPP